MPAPQVQQLSLTEKDRDRLVYRIRDDYASFSADLQARQQAMRRWYRLSRNAMEPEGFPAEERSNLSIPLVLWTIKAKVAKEMDVLFGEESEIVVTPLGQSDVARAAKIQKWMTWRVKSSLKLFKTYYQHLLQKYIYGMSPLSVAWNTKIRRIKRNAVIMVPQEVRDPASGLTAIMPIPQIQEQEEDVIDFDGPEITVENLEDWFFPARSKDILAGDFIRRLRLSIDDILQLRDQGKLDAQTVTDKFEDLKRIAKNGSFPDGVVSDEKAAQSGVSTNPTGRAEEMVVYNWCGKFRFGVNDDETGGEERATEIVAFFEPQQNILLGVCRRIDIFPDGLQHFIISQAGLDPNNAYGIGLCEQLEPISNEMDAFHRLAVSAGEGSIGPVIFYEPGAGYDPEKHKLEAFSAIPTANAAGVKVVNLGQIQLAPYTILMQMLQSFAERLTAINDPQLGRQSAQPNAPRTFGQQQLLQNESNTYLLLDIRLEREMFHNLLHLVWEMDKRYLAKPVFFRVTETDPGDVMTDEDMQGDYDFNIGPVTSVSNRAQKTQELMQAFQIANAMQIPVLSIALLKKLLVRLGQDDVAMLLPNVEAIRPPMPPQEENTRLWQGESVEPTPLDNHPEHIAIHTQFMQELQQTQIAGVSLAAASPSTIPRITAHIAKHEAAARQMTAAIAGAAGLLGLQPQGRPGSDGGDGGDGPAPSQPNPFEQAQSDNASMLNQNGLNLA